MLQFYVSLPSHYSKLGSNSCCCSSYWYTGAVSNTKYVGIPEIETPLWVLFEFLAYFVCCSVSLLTLRNPAGSVNSLLELRAGGVAIGGVI